MSVASVASSVSNSTLIQNYINSQTAAQKAAASSSTSSSTGSTASSTATSISDITGDFNTFLKILTTQLQNQDPTDATDPNQFTQELVQFSGVEQQIDTNAKLDTLISASNPNGITPLLNYVGKYVEAPITNNDIVVQNGTSQFAYNLPSTASSATITISDSSGNTVATMNGPTTAGLNRISWNGTESDGSTQAPDGTYTMKLAATDSSGKSMSVTDIRMIGQVTGIQTDSNQNSTLSIGGVSVKDTAIDAVFNSATGA